MPAASRTPRHGAGSGRLSGEIAVVTGSTSGLGAEIARRFGSEGAQVVVTGRSVERGRAVADEIRGAGGEADFLGADLTSEEECSALVDAAAARYGGLTVLVNNAVASDDMSADGRVGDLTTQAWEGVLRVALTAVVWLCRAAIPHMERTGHGSIVNVSSRAAERATPGLAAYAAAKGGLNSLTRSIATDYADAGIRCNTLSPGYILHDRRDAGLDDTRRRQLEASQLTRLTEASDVAAAAVYLAGRESDVVTGILLPVDGGSTVARAASLG